MAAAKITPEFATTSLRVKIQLAWKIVEFLETIADLILEHYTDDSPDDDFIEDITPDGAWTE